MRRPLATMAAIILTGGLALGLPALTTPASAEVVDGIHFTYTGPGSVTFDWRGAATDLRLGLTTAYTSTFTGVTPNPVPWSSAGPFREARLTGLQPATTYHYSIGGGPDRTFRTMPQGDFRFIVTGDIGASTTYSAVTKAQQLVAADKPDFVLATGDLTYANPKGTAKVDDHFNDVMAWSTSAAYMPIWGNHEHSNPSYDDLRNYKGRFDLPNSQTSPNSPTAGGEDWYWFDVAGVRFIAYPEPWSGAWTDWKPKADALMAAAQADSSIRTIMTFGHRPAYTTGDHGPNATLAGMLDGFGDKYSKYLVNFASHNHTYERFTPIHRVTHFTAAGGGASLTGFRTSDSRIAYRADHLEHLRVDVTATGITFSAICGPSASGEDISCTPGSVLDTFVIGTPTTSNPPAPSPAPASPSPTPAAGSPAPTAAPSTAPAPASPAPTTTASSTTNLIGNGSFEAGTEGWKPSSGCSLAGTGDALAGSRAAQIRNSGTASATCTLNDSPNWVTAASTSRHTLSAWVRSPVVGSVTLRLREYAGTTNVGSASTSMPLTVGWQLVTLPYVPKQAGSALDANVYVSSLAAGAAFDVDDVVLIRG